MPKFISKVQYLACEEGEYYDEKPRNLEETLELMNNSPWANAQYTDLELTGPSVTILDDNGNYLKIRIHFAERFTAYHFGVDKHCHKKERLNASEVYEIVREFFDGRLNLQSFEKLPFLSFRKRDFISKSSEYGMSLWGAVLLGNDLNFWTILFAALLLLIMFGQSSLSIRMGFLLIIILGLVVVADRVMQTFSKLVKKKRAYLKISRGNPEFLYGDSPDEITVYNKTDVKEIISYQNENYKSPNNITITRIVFKDDSVICLPNSVIASSTLLSKFSDKWNCERTVIKTNFWEMLRYL